MNQLKNFQNMSALGVIGLFGFWVINNTIYTGKKK